MRNSDSGDLEAGFNLNRALGCAFVLAVLSGSLATAETFCALTVHLEDSHGKPPTSTWIELIDPTGKVEKREMVRGPTLRICDFGFGRYSIRIAPNECHPILISNLRLELGHPITLDVRRSRCEGEEYHTGCKVFVRVTDAQANKLAGATILSEGHPWQMQPDEYGRAETLLYAGEREITVSKDEYRAQSITIKCEEGSNVYREVVLEHK